MHVFTGKDPDILSMSRRDLYMIMKESGQIGIDDRIQFLKTQLALTTNSCQDDQLNELYNTLSHFTSRFKEKWVHCNRTESRFIEKNQKWLDEVISFKVYKPPTEENKQRGRPSLLTNVPNERNGLKLKV
jgi:hypothetical protein